MDLEFTEDQEDLRRSVRDFLDAECPTSVVRQVIEDGPPADKLWGAMQALDWPALVVPEEYGGIGGGAPELAVLAEELGRHVAPVPLLATVSQFVPVVRELGDDQQRERFLRGVAEGGLTGALALADHPARWSLADVTAVAHPDGDGWRLTGEKRGVMAGPEVDELAVVARRAPAAGSGTSADGKDLAAFVVPTADLTFRQVEALDASRPLSSVELGNARIGPDRVLGAAGEVGPGLRRALEEATIAVALETVGCCDELFSLTREHALERHQFGVPIGSFQAVKHKMADLFVVLARARALCYYAVAAIEEDASERSVAVAMAKAASDDCQRQVCQESLQTLGGIGFTWEHDAHLFVKRAKSDGALFGGASEHRPVVAEAFGVGPARSLPG